MTTTCIVQARLGSSRLPAKVLLPLPTGRTVLQEVVVRCLQINGVDSVVVATPDNDDVDIIEYNAWGVPVYVGPEANVLHRYVMAADAECASTIMRITSDCPMIDPDICSRVLEIHKARSAHYTSNVWPSREWPPGYDCEVFSYEALIAAHNANGKTSDDMEHVTPLIRKFAHNAEAVQILKSSGDIDWVSRTLDTLDDYRHIWRLLQNEARAGRIPA